MTRLIYSNEFTPYSLRIYFHEQSQRLRHIDMWDMNENKEK